MESVNNVEKYKLWQFFEIRKLNQNITLIRNDYNNQLMIKTELPKENFVIMQTLEKINHPNLMRVYDTILMNNKCVSICEYIDGNTLEYNVENYKPYNNKYASSIICQICDGLYVLHRNNIVHRDINPTNVMINKQGVVKIIDFDIVRTYNNHKSRDTQVLGTAGYAAPEQFGFSQTDPRADVYSCGVLLNYLLTGVTPDQIMHKGKYYRIIRKATEMDADNRYVNILQMRDDILDDGDKYAKYNPKESNVSLVPGFRKNVGWHKVLAVIGYIWFLLISITWINEFINSFTSSYSDPFQVFMCGFVSIILMIAIPFVFLFKLFGVKKLFKHFDKSRRDTYCIITAAVIFAIANIIYRYFS